MKKLRKKSKIMNNEEEKTKILKTLIIMRYDAKIENREKIR